MDRQRTVFWVGFLIYIVSFFLPFEGGRGVYTPTPPSGADCAADWLFFPWVYLHIHNLSTFLKDAPIGKLTAYLRETISDAESYTGLNVSR